MIEKPSASRPIVDIIRTHAERLALDAEERLHQRQRALAEQTAIANPPDVRIRAWEKVHALRMPGDTTHPILDVIAYGTGLTLAQVHEEQSVRLALRTKRAAGQLASDTAKSTTSNSDGSTPTP